MLCHIPAILNTSIPVSTKPLYRLHQRLHTPKGIGRVIGIQECPGPEKPCWYYRLVDVPDEESAWEPTWWLEDQVWPELDFFMILIECLGSHEPCKSYCGTIEDLIEDFQGITKEMLDSGEPWKITLERLNSFESN